PWHSSFAFRVAGGLNGETTSPPSQGERGYVVGQPTGCAPCAQSFALPRLAMPSHSHPLAAGAGWLGTTLHHVPATCQRCANESIVNSPPAWLCQLGDGHVTAELCRLLG